MGDLEAEVAVEMLGGVSLEDVQGDDTGLLLQMPEGGGGEAVALVLGQDGEVDAVEALGCALDEVASGGGSVFEGEDEVPGVRVLGGAVEGAATVLRLRELAAEVRRQAFESGERLGEETLEEGLVSGGGWPKGEDRNGGGCGRHGNGTRGWPDGGARRGCAGIAAKKDAADSCRRLLR